MCVLAYLFIKKITENVEVDPKLFPADTEEVHGIGENNQVVADHIIEVVLSSNPSHQSIWTCPPLYVCLPDFPVGQGEDPAGQVPHQCGERYVSNLGDT